MATMTRAALVQELDSFTPCILIRGDGTQEKNYRRLDFLIQKILATSERYFTQRQKKKIIEALYYSAKKHQGVYRKDNIRPYFLHPLEVVLILIELKIYDFKIMIAAILHDVVEDTDASLREISIHFGSAVRNIVDLMTKHPNFIRKWRYWSLMKEEVDLNCRWRVLVLKFADRIHNMMTLDAVPEESRKNKIKETVTEFPSLGRTLSITLSKLYQRGTIKKKYYLMVPFLLQNRLAHEMERYK